LNGTRQWLRESIEAQLEDPNVRALRERDEELGRYKAKEQEEMTKREKAQYESFVSERKEAIGKTLSEAMQLSPLSKDPVTQAETLREMAVYIRICREQGHDPSPKELAQHVENKTLKSYASVANQLDGDELLSFLGDAIVNKIRKADVGRLQAKRNAPAPEVSSSWEPNSRSTRREFQDPRDLKIGK